MSFRPGGYANLFGNIQEAKDFLRFLNNTTAGGRPGLTVVSILLVELERTIDLRIARIEVFKAVQELAQKRGLKVFRLLDRGLILVPSQNQRDSMRDIYDIRMLVAGTVSARASELGIEPGSFVEVLHTYRDAKRLRGITATTTGAPKLLTTPITQDATLTEDHIAALKERIAAVGDAQFMDAFGRYQAIARLRAGGRPATAGWEVFVAVSEINRIFFPRMRLIDSPLWYDLTLVLDKVVIANALASSTPENHISLNLNVETVASTDFFWFAKHLAEHEERAKAELWVELRPDDLARNRDAFISVEMALRQLRVFFLVDHVTRTNIREVLSQDYPVDAYKIVYDKDDADFSGISKDMARLAERDAVLMSRIDSQEALNLARANGARRVQGYFIDRQLSQGETEGWG